MADKCIVRDGKFVEPCQALYDATEIGNPGGKRRGIFMWHLTNLETHKPSRSFVGIVSTGYPKGLAFNVCPWCGERIDAPFEDDF